VNIERAGAFDDDIHRDLLSSGSGSPLARSLDCCRI